MPKLMLDRSTLSRLLQGNQQAIFAFERIQGDVDGVLPSTIEEANALAGQALAVAQAALVSLTLIAEALEALESAPASPPQVEPDDTAPRAHLGTMGAQDAHQVEIAGGSAALSALDLSGPLVSTVEEDPPLIVASLARVANLNVERAALADEASKLANPTTLPPAATDAASTLLLANALRAAAIEKGL